MANKTIIKKIVVTRCWDCPHLRHTTEESKCSWHNRKLDFKESIPDWCELPDNE